MRLFALFINISCGLIFMIIFIFLGMALGILRSAGLYL